MGLSAFPAQNIIAFLFRTPRCRRMETYFDAPPGERVLREFTIRRDASGHWLVVEEPGSVTCAFYTCDAAERYALRAAGGDQHRVHFARGDAAAVADR